jgi:hypothetical protein
MNNTFEKIKQEGEKLQHVIKEKVIGYILAGLGVVAGLAWNEAIKTFIEFIFPLNRNTILAKFIYAFLVTFVIVIISVYFINLLNKSNKDKDDRNIN